MLRGPKQYTSPCFMFSHSHSVLGNGITDWIIKQDMIAAKYFYLVRQRQKRHFLRRWSRLCMKGTCLPCFLHIFHSCQRITERWMFFPLECEPGNCIYGCVLHVCLMVMSNAISHTRWTIIAKMQYVFQLTVCSGKLYWLSI